MRMPKNLQTSKRRKINKQTTAELQAFAKDLVSDNQVTSLVYSQVMARLAQK